MMARITIIFCFAKPQFAQKNHTNQPSHSDIIYVVGLWGNKVGYSEYAFVIGITAHVNTL